MDVKKARKDIEAICEQHVFFGKKKRQTSKIIHSREELPFRSRRGTRRRKSSRRGEIQDRHPMISGALGNLLCDYSISRCQQQRPPRRQRRRSRHQRDSRTRAGRSRWRIRQNRPAARSAEKDADKKLRPTTNVNVRWIRTEEKTRKRVSCPVESFHQVCSRAQSEEEGRGSRGEVD